jgi:thiol-disulfide isomerase/thioredoxin
MTSQEMLPMRVALFLCLSLLLLAGCTSQFQQPAPPANVSTPLHPGITAQIPSQNISNTAQNQAAFNISSNPTQENKTYNFSPVYSSDGKLMVYFFYSSTCPSCRAVGPYVEYIGKKYENQTEWQGYDIDTGYGRDAYLQYYKDFNISQARAGVPAIIVNNTVLWGRYEINDSLEMLINGSLPVRGNEGPA